MPCIETKTNVPISAGKEDALRRRFGKAIALLPGKSESWLMLSFQGDCALAFRGETQPKIALLHVSLFGSAAASDYERLTAELTRIVSEELGVEAACIYVIYDEVKYWGWNGGNL